MEERVKVLYITDMYDAIGGAEKNLYDIARNIDKKKFIPYVICLQGGKTALLTEKMGIWKKNLNLKKIYGMQAIKEAIKLFKLIKSEKFKIIVTYHNASDFWGGLIGRIAGVPVIISNRRDMGYKLKKRHIWLYRLFNRLFDQIICVSNAVKEVIDKREWTDQNKMKTIYNGIDISEYSPKIDKQSLKKELGLKEDKKIVGMVANFREIKGQIYFVQSIKEIIKEFKDVQFLIVGYKDTDYFLEVNKLIDELGLKENIFCIGPRDDIPELLSIFDISVLSSINEGFSNIILESMASGKPVIAGRSGGNPESIIDGETGVLFTPCNIQELSKAILKLLKDEKLGICMGEKGKEKVINDFTLDKMMKKTEELYEYLLFYKQMRLKLFLDYFGILKYFYLKRYMKIIFSYLFYYSGFTPLYMKYFKKPSKILAYHSIGDNHEWFFGMNQKKEIFEKQIRYLNKYYKFISLSDYCKSIKNGRINSFNSLIVTFDDGYKDNYTNAFPVLNKNNIPATIFISTDPLKNKEPLFFDMITYAVYNTNKKYLDLSEMGLHKYLLINRFLKYKTSKELISAGKQMSSSERKLLIKYLFKVLDLNIEDLKNSNIYLSWEEIKDMLKRGIEIGAHTESHPSLSFLAKEEIKSQISNSKKILENKLERKISSFAYPYGGKLDISREVEKIAGEVGFECCCVLCEDKYEVKPNVMALSRKAIDDLMTTNFAGRFAKPLIAAEVSGIFDKIIFWNRK